MARPCIAAMTRGLKSTMTQFYPHIFIREITRVARSHGVLAHFPLYSHRYEGVM